MHVSLWRAAVRGDAIEFRNAKSNAAIQSINASHNCLALVFFFLWRLRARFIIIAFINMGQITSVVIAAFETTSRRIIHLAQLNMTEIEGNTN